MQCPPGIQMLGQRQLDEDPVHLRVRVQTVDEGVQFPLGEVRIRTEFQRPDSGLLTGLHLAPHIDLRRRIRADQDHREAGRPGAARDSFRHPHADLLKDPLSMGLAIQDLGHGPPLPTISPAFPGQGMD